MMIWRLVCVLMEQEKKRYESEHTYACAWKVKMRKWLCNKYSISAACLRPMGAFGCGETRSRQVSKRA